MVMIWCEDPKVYTDAKVLHRDKLLDLPFSVGKPLKGVFPENVQILSTTKPLDFFDAGHKFVVSEKIRRLIEMENANVEIFQTPVVYRKQTLNDFFLINILDNLDCIDEARTVCAKRHLLRYHYVKRLALNLDIVQNVPMFRIKESILVGVSDSLAAKIEQAKSTGVVFKTPEEWRNPVLLGE